MDQTKIVKKTYSQYMKSLPVARDFFKRPLTYTEKILFSHLVNR